MSTRVKAPSLESRLEFERVVDEIARMTVSLRKVEAKRDEQLQRVRSEFEPSVVEITQRIEALSVMAEKYATEHAADLLPGKLKSAETPLAMWGFRTGMPTLKTLSKWTWDKVLSEIKNHRALRKFVRSKEEVDKAAIIAAATRRPKFAGPILATIGCKVAQEETFFIEPKEKSAEVAA